MKMLIGAQFGKNGCKSKRVGKSLGRRLQPSRTSTFAILLLTFSCGYDLLGYSDNPQSNWLIQSVHCFDAIDDFPDEPFLNCSQQFDNSALIVTNLTGPNRQHQLASVQLNQNKAKPFNFTFNPSTINLPQHEVPNDVKPGRAKRGGIYILSEEDGSHFAKPTETEKSNTTKIFEKYKFEKPLPDCICNCTIINSVELMRNQSTNQAHCDCTQRCAHHHWPQIDSTPIIDGLLNRIYKSYFNLNPSINNCSLRNYPKYCKCSLANVFCVGGQLKGVPPEDLLSNELVRLDLSNNQLNTIPSDSFASRFHQLEALTMFKSQINRIEMNAFRDLPNLTYLNLIGNALVKIEINTFQNCSNLKLLYLSHNPIVSLMKGSFNGLASLLELDLGYCELTQIEIATFAGMGKLEVLLLTRNRIERIDPDAFNDLYSLRTLSLSYNRLRLISSGLFWDIRNLKTLLLTFNLLAGIKPENIEELIELKHLDLSHNKIDYLKENNFGNMTKLNFLDLRKNRLLSYVPKSFLKYNGKLENVYFDYFRMCSYALNVSTCHPRSDGISNVYDLIGSPFLRICLWIIATIACLGNIGIIFLPIHEQGRVVHSRLMRILAISHLVMAVYLWMIVYYDWAYRGEYIRIDEKWRRSASCRFAGVMHFLSYESSVFIMSYITADRYFTVIYPLMMKQRSALFATLAMIAIWIISILLTVLPLMFDTESSFSSDLLKSQESITFRGDAFYGSNGICMAFKLNETFSSDGWAYPAVLYIVLPIIAVVFVSYAYAQLALQPVPKVYPKRYNQRQQQKRLDEYLKLKEKNKYFVWRCDCLVVSNVMGWLLFAIVKCLSLVKMPINEQLFGWIVLFGFPLNAALNPIFFVLTSEMFNEIYDINVADLIALYNNWRIVTKQDRVPKCKENQAETKL